jgi:hypothetical protein
MSGSGNGIDIAAVYQLLVQVSETLGVHSKVLDNHTAVLQDHSQILNDHTRVMNDHTRVLNDHSRILNDQTRVLNDHTLMLHDHGRRLADIESGQASLRQEVAQYHASVMGHGILISDLDHRVRRIEEHLNLPHSA